MTATHVARLIRRIRSSAEHQRITPAQRDQLLGELGRGLERQGRCPECGDRHPVVAKPGDVEKTVRWVATGLPPKRRPEAHVTPPAPQRPLPATSVAPLTPRERAYRAIIDAAEELMEQKGGKITQAEAVAEVVQRKPHLYTRYRNATDDKSGGTTAA